VEYFDGASFVAASPDVESAGSLSSATTEAVVVMERLRVVFEAVEPKSASSGAGSGRPGFGGTTEARVAVFDLQVYGRVGN